ncbi:energy transducer TonB [Methylomonas sp. SURF-2]|uniref:Protein TonB n=1 Tax=Methylomonas subterranea TaxID=2952225 RepID=A0ABT1TK30_9GAMM|nr:energy transducer TonB [Methylomonas sp. SURF-2]
MTIHLAWLTLLPEQHPETAITPPQPIMVSWVGTAEAKTTMQPVAQPVQHSEPAVKKPKPKPIAKTTKPKPLLTTASETVSPMAAPSSEPEQLKPQPAPPVSSQPAPASSVADAPTEENNPAPTTLPSLHADYLNNPAPAYPDQSRQQGEQGRVLVRVLVTTDGTVDQVNLRKSSGYPRLDSAALETVKNWRFVPAQHGSRVVSAWVVVPISFSLEG